MSVDKSLPEGLSSAPVFGLKKKTVVANPVFNVDYGLFLFHQSNTVPQTILSNWLFQHALSVTLNRSATFVEHSCFETLYLFKKSLLGCLTQPQVVPHHIHQRLFIRDHESIKDFWHFESETPKISHQTVTSSQSVQQKEQYMSAGQSAHSICDRFPSSLLRLLWLDPCCLDTVHTAVWLGHSQASEESGVNGTRKYPFFPRWINLS